jgi:hypothetical protein
VARLLCLALLPWAALAQLHDSNAAPRHAPHQRVTADPPPDAAANKALALRDEDHLADRQATTLL